MKDKMKIAKNTIVTAFVVYSVFSLVVRIPLIAGTLVFDTPEYTKVASIISSIFPLNMYAFMVVAFFSSGKVIACLLAAAMMLMMIIPIVGCIFLKKPWVYRLLAYPMAFFCFAELLVEFGSLPDFIYATTVILIDVLNMIYIKREKCRLKAEAANEAKVISDETIDI